MASRPGEPNTILVYVGADLLGDGLIQLPFVRALRAAYPRARITWLAGKGKSVFGGPLKPLVAGLIDEVIDDVRLGLSYRELTRRPLRGRRFDLVIDTQRKVRTTIIVRGIRHRRFISGALGFLLSDARPPGPFLRSLRKPPAWVDQLLELVTAARGEVLEAPDPAPLALPEEVKALAEQLLPAGARYVAMAPGAGGRHKCWPLERFAALGQRLAARDLVPIYILGPQELEWQASLSEAFPEARFPLNEAPPAKRSDPLLTIALAARAAACLANDSGGGHLFAASGTPLVSLFGPTRPSKFAPRAARVTILQAGDYGGEEMSAIPIEAVEAAVMAEAEGAQDGAQGGAGPADQAARSSAATSAA